jgi:hypothetical protein
MGKPEIEKFVSKDDFWYFGKSAKSVLKNNKVEDEYLEDLLYYGSMVGVSEDTIIEMFDSGYSYMEIEDMLFELECGYDEEAEYDDDI